MPPPGPVRPDAGVEKPYNDPRITLILADGRLAPAGGVRAAGRRPTRAARPQVPGPPCRHDRRPEPRLRQPARHPVRRAGDGGAVGAAAEVPDVAAVVAGTRRSGSGTRADRRRRRVAPHPAGATRRTAGTPGRRGPEAG